MLLKHTCHHHLETHSSVPFCGNVGRQLLLFEDFLSCSSVKNCGHIIGLRLNARVHNNPTTMTTSNLPPPFRAPVVIMCVSHGSALESLEARIRSRLEALCDDPRHKERVPRASAAHVTSDG
ncbi:unnamed protein product [Polarella glacialis]|uniref:Uncharacterized protein n=1 Tax=Polarella glacialis TaxID=89957 RepID=A0A813KQ21_POLGL|nr:unnamed protein product [Polarella glacialis]